MSSVSQWWAAEDRQWRYRCAHAGICYECGEELPKHEDGCANAPEADDKEDEE